MAKGLTSKQQQILEYIQSYVQKEGYPPSIREIGRDFEIGSLRGVTVHLDALTRKGYISRSNTPRSIKVVHPEFQPPSHVAMLPLFGTIAAGAPIHADDHIEDTLPVPSEMVRNVPDAFLLRVQGDSMIGDGIFERDLVIVKPQETARQNELIAALIGDEATIKRFDNAKNGPQLLASNPAYQPIPFGRDDARIIGKIIGLLRDYEGRAF